MVNDDEMYHLFRVEDQQLTAKVAGRLTATHASGHVGVDILGPASDRNGMTFIVNEPARALLVNPGAGVTWVGTSRFENLPLLTESLSMPVPQQRVITDRHGGAWHVTNDNRDLLFEDADTKTMIRIPAHRAVASYAHGELVELLEQFHPAAGPEQEQL